MGANGWEIDAHSNSAPDHEPIQGKQYYDADYEALNNSLVRRIGTLNCGHAAFPVILGVSLPQYSTSELETMRDDNEKGIEYNGKHYTGYEATQRQRQLEAAIRKQKRCILVDGATGDTKKLETDRIKLQTLRQEYNRFSKAAGLRTQTERAEVAGFGYKEANAADKAYKDYQKSLEKSSESDTMVLPDIEIGKSVGAKAKNYDIKLPNAEIIHLSEGTRVTNVQVIAGKGRNRKIDEVLILLERYPGSKESDWQKVKGIGYVDYQGESYRAALHWYQEQSVGKVEWKVKPDAAGNWFIDDD